jgi:hypothetical protein
MRVSEVAVGPSNKGLKELTSPEHIEGSQFNPAVFGGHHGSAKIPSG